MNINSVLEKNHSTNFALIYLVDRITKALDNREFAVGVFLDLSKARRTREERAEQNASQGS